MTIVDRIQILCNKHGTTLTGLERTLNFGRSTMGKWVTSSPTINKLGAVADYFNVSIDFLRTGEENNDRIFGFNGDSEDMLNSYGGLNSEEKEEAKAFLKFLHSQNKSKGDKNC